MIQILALILAAIYFYYRIVHPEKIVANISWIFPLVACILLAIVLTGCKFNKTGYENFREVQNAGPKYRCHVGLSEVIFLTNDYLSYDWGMAFTDINGKKVVCSPGTSCWCEEL